MEDERTRAAEAWARAGSSSLFPREQGRADRGTSGGMTILRLLLLLLWVGYALSMAQVPASELNGFGKMVSFSLFAAAPLLYFLPTIEAALRFHPNQTSITLVNLLLGWTLLGWVVAIAWACKSQTVPNGRWDPDYGAYCSQRQVGAGISRQAAASARISAVEELTKLADLKDRGALTQEEFDAQKAKILAQP